MKVLFTRQKNLKKPGFLSVLGLIVCCLALVFGKANAQGGYCTPTYYSSGTGWNCYYLYFNITNVSLTGYSGSTLNDNYGTCTGNGYQDRTSAVSAVDLQQGNTYSGSLSLGTSSSDIVEQAYAIWIDFNNDSIFENSEQVVPTYYNPCCTYAYLFPFTINIPLTAPTGNHRMRIRYIGEAPSMPDSIPACSMSYTYASGSYHYPYTAYYGDARDYLVNIVAAPNCSGAPSVTTSPSGNISLCVGGTETLTGTAGVYNGFSYQWQKYIAGVWTNVSGDTTTIANFVVGSSPDQYRMRVICSFSGDTSYSKPDTLTPGSPTYASIPYFQDFENWQNYCDVNDVPDGHWVNRPTHGDSSWRRNDQGVSSGGWSHNPYDAYSPASVSGSHSAEFNATSSNYGYGYGYMYTGGTPPPFNYQGNMDLYLNCSGATGGKELYFYWISPPYSGSPYNTYNTDSLKVLVSTDGGITFNQVWGMDTASTWTHVAVPIASNSATTIVRFQGQRTGVPPSGYTYDYQWYGIGLDSVYVAPPCTGAPTAGSITPGGPLSGCAGASYNLSLSGTTLAGNLSFKWQKSNDGGISWTYTSDTTPNINTGPIFKPVQYKATVLCKTSGDSATTSSLSINLSGGAPTYSGIPYVQSFENWLSRCGTYDIPDSSWASFPASGPNSWHREDQGGTYGCWYPYGTTTTPPSADSSHSAGLSTYELYSYCDYHYYTSPANLYLLSNCATVIGNKELQFYWNNPSPSSTSYGNDTLQVLYSTDNGSTFTSLGKFGPGSGWQFYKVPLPSNSAQTVIDFKCLFGGQYTFVSNVGLDLVKILPPCQDKPAAGTINNAVPCSGVDFQLNLVGATQAAGLAYAWQRSSDGKTWATIPNDTFPTITENIIANTYYRAIVTCTNSGLSDTTPIQYLKLAPFYVCYCNAAASATYKYLYSSVGNFSIVAEPSGDSLLDNGNPLPLTNNTNPRTSIPYVGYDTLVSDIHTLPMLYRDSLYQLYVTENTSYPSWYLSNYPVNIYLDEDHSGTYETSELILNKTMPYTYSPTLALATVTDTFRVPDTLMVGITGMRVATGYAYSSPISPCGETNFYNQQIDYLVNIGYHPCAGPVDAGTAVISDSTMCVGYTYTLTDTTHEYHQSGITWQWQQSTDKSTWASFGAADVDTMTLSYTTSLTSYYRLRMICDDSHDTTYSNVVKVTIAPPYACYCYSMAVGGSDADSSDIGAFTIGSYVVSKGGPHVLNPVAISGRTDHTGTIINLDADSTYPVGVYQILKSATHGDAKVTLFMDFNNNLMYDVPYERVWSTTTSASDWYLTTNITIPDTVIADVPTGMRLILNNNTAPNAASDDGCGPYTSGETEDFVVKFKRVSTGIGTLNSIDHLAVYPNPTTGKFTVEFNASTTVKELQISVSNVTGQQVLVRNYSNTSGHFSTELDMSEQPRGVYFIEFMADGERKIQKLVVR